MRVAEIQTAGFYGKLPGKGDFVTRRLPRTFIDVWDPWLQNAMGASRAALGETWLDTYLTSPLWRFVLSRGVCGPAPWTGVMMPSVDSVGRYFPLTLVSALAVDCNPFRVAGAVETSPWFKRAEELALSALDPAAFDMERFDAEVAGLGPARPPAAPIRASGDIASVAAQGQAWFVPVPAVDHVAGVWPELNLGLVGSRFGSFSLWWTAGSDTIPPSLLVCAGLPLPDGFAALLSGQWRTGPWTMWPLEPREVPVSPAPVAVAATAEVSAPPAEQTTHLPSAAPPDIELWLSISALSA